MVRPNVPGWVALLLLIVGGLNWCLVGALNFDVVATIFGKMTTPSRVIYIVVGLAAIYSLVTALVFCKPKTGGE